MYKDLSLFLLVFAAFLFFTSGYIYGLGQNLSGGCPVVKELHILTQED